MGPLVARVEPYALVGLSPGTHLRMPSNHLTLVLTLDAPLELSGGPIGPDRHRLRVSLAGLHTTPVSIHHEGRMRGIQLALTPAGCRALLACPAGELAERERFHIAEIGSVTVAPRQPRRYFNPRTLAEAVSEGDHALKINISKAMRARLNGHRAGRAG